MAYWQSLKISYLNSLNTLQVTNVVYLVFGLPFTRWRQNLYMSDSLRLLTIVLSQSSDMSPILYSFTFVDHATPLPLPRTDSLAGLLLASQVGLVTSTGPPYVPSLGQVTCTTSAGPHMSPGTNFTC